MGDAWRHIDDIPQRQHLEGVNPKSIACYREYHPHDMRPAGFPWIMETDNLISNFQKDVAYKTRPEVWHYKLEAIETFSSELAAYVARNIVGRDFALAAMPSSRCETDSDYDSRIVDVLQRVKAKCPTIALVKPLVRTVTMPKLKSVHGSRDPDKIAAGLLITDEVASYTCKAIVLVDDVLTSGSTFKAAKRLIKAARPDLGVVGVFWAKSVRKPLF